MSTPAKSIKDHYHHGDLRAAVLKRAAEVIEAEGIEAMSLRRIARDLGVSHGAPNRHFKTKADLLAALATDAWLKMQAATIEAAETCGSPDPRIQLHAMGCAYMRWALNNRSLFAATMHPDVSRFADDTLREAIQNFRDVVQDVVVRAQAGGRHPGKDPLLLTLYTNSVPFGASVLLSDPLLATNMADHELEHIIKEIIDLVVPLD